jgi:ketosteroid isomerase-like protein
MSSTGPHDVSPEEIVRCIYDAFESGEFRTPASYFRDDVEAYVSDFVPWGGVRRGVGQVKEGLLTMRRYATLSFEVSEFLDGGRCLVAVGRTSGVVHATCEPFCVDAVHLWHFRDGKVAGFEYYLDEALAPLFQDLPQLEIANLR